jgi:glycosyltransferase involved in cell wall biosynthesis
MQYRKPVIAGQSGGIPDVVQDGITGLLVPPDKPDALAGAIVHLFQHPEQARAMGESGWNRVNEKYLWNDIAAQYLSEMQECERAG